MTLKKTPLLFFLICTYFSLSASSLPVSFIENDLETAKVRAHQEKKLIMVDFWASWCSPCKWMDEQTFSQQHVADYLNHNYISVRIDVDNLDGNQYMSQYGIKLLPTILILNPDGKIVKKYEQSMAPSTLINVLKDHDENKVLPPYVNRNMVQSISKPVNRSTKEVKMAPAYHPITTGKSHAMLASYNKKVTSNLNKEIENKPSMVNEKPSTNNYTSQTTTRHTETIYKANGVGKISDSPINDYGSSQLNATSNIGLYQLNVKKGPNDGFSVQVGAYYDYKNVLTEVAKFQKSFAEEVLVHISELNGTTCYKVMLGHYLSYEEASKDKSLLIESGVRDAFVKDITTLNATGNLAVVDY